MINKKILFIYITKQPNVFSREISYYFNIEKGLVLSHRTIFHKFMHKTNFQEHTDQNKIIYILMSELIFLNIYSCTRIYLKNFT